MTGEKSSFSGFFTPLNLDILYITDESWAEQTRNIFLHRSIIILHENVRIEQKKETQKPQNGTWDLKTERRRKSISSRSSYLKYYEQMVY